MQIVDFFDVHWCSYTKCDNLFFIFDKQDNSPVLVSSDNNIQSISVNIRNDSMKTCWILPVDHNLVIKKDGSNDDESTCDYLMTVNKNEQLLFGEIKTGRKGWEADGINQLKKTICIFKANHNVDNWAIQKAYVSNYRRWNARQSTMSKQEKFKDEIGIRLYIKNEVDIDNDL